MMIKNISFKMFCFFILASLCFGQITGITSDPKASLSVSRSKYLSPLSEVNCLTAERMALHSLPNTSYSNYFLVMQVEGESLKPKTPPLKRLGIYGLEFSGAGIGTSIFALFSLGEPTPTTLCAYFIGASLVSGSGVWTIGSWFNQKGLWWKAMLGGVAGSLTGILLPRINDWDLLDWRYCTTVFIAPPLGATIGLNF
ncbi:MAG: hypothetical protein LUQ65_14875 [Candidatus Helarchaeota archaeon]|nr:hypothetical protein [Candidatus Helarchaeota archaeon]